MTIFEGYTLDKLVNLGHLLQLKRIEKQIRKGTQVTVNQFEGAVSRRFLRIK